MYLILFLGLLTSLLDGPPCDDSVGKVCDVRSLMDAGQLDEARNLAIAALEDASSPELQFALHLELAKVLDRIGLHQNTRPVEAVWQHIQLASDVFEDPSDLMRAELALRRANYYYRAEMAERRFPQALMHATEALDLARKAGSKHAEADALHRFGLIHLQRGEHATARVFFDQSLAVDEAAGHRAAMLGDYERHVGFLYLMGGEFEKADPYFRRSLKHRREGGLVDQSMFAAETYGSNLVRIGEAVEAEIPLMYALGIAEDMQSPVATARIALALARMHEARGDMKEAVRRFEQVLDLAAAFGSDSMAQTAESSIARLTQ